MAESVHAAGGDDDAMSLVGPRACLLIPKEEVKRRAAALFEELGLTVGLEDDGRLHMRDLRDFATTSSGGFTVAALTHFEVLFLALITPSS